MVNTEDLNFVIGIVGREPITFSIPINELTYEGEQLYLEQQFGRPDFDISIPINELDEVVSDNPEIVIKNTYGCYCYTGCYRPTDYFVIRANRITNRVIIHELIRQGFDPRCNHIFLEGFNKCNPCSIEYECIMGS